jgi:hypothetical protein
LTPRSLIGNPRPGLHRRIKRGVVAGYLHELSQRHSTTAAPRTVRTPAATVARDDRAPAAV